MGDMGSDGSDNELKDSVEVIMMTMIMLQAQLSCNYHIIIMQLSYNYHAIIM